MYRAGRLVRRQGVAAGGAPAAGEDDDGRRLAAQRALQAHQFELERRRRERRRGRQRARAARRATPLELLRARYRAMRPQQDCYQGSF